MEASASYSPKNPFVSPMLPRGRRGSYSGPISIGIGEAFNLAPATSYSLSSLFSSVGTPTADSFHSPTRGSYSGKRSSLAAGEVQDDELGELKSLRLAFKLAGSKVLSDRDKLALLLCNKTQLETLSTLQFEQDKGLGLAQLLNCQMKLLEGYYFKGNKKQGAEEYREKTKPFFKGSEFEVVYEAAPNFQIIKELGNIIEQLNADIIALRDKMKAEPGESESISGKLNSHIMHLLYLKEMRAYWFGLSTEDPDVIVSEYILYKGELAKLFEELCSYSTTPIRPEPDVFEQFFVLNMVPISDLHPSLIGLLKERKLKLEEQIANIREEIVAKVEMRMEMVKNFIDLARDDEKEFSDASVSLTSINNTSHNDTLLHAAIRGGSIVNVQLFLNDLNKVLAELGVAEEFFPAMNWRELIRSKNENGHSPFQLALLEKQYAIAVNLFLKVFQVEMSNEDLLLQDTLLEELSAMKEHHQVAFVNKFIRDVGGSRNLISLLTKLCSFANTSVFNYFLSRIMQDAAVDYISSHCCVIWCGMQGRQLLAMSQSVPFDARSVLEFVSSLCHSASIIRNTSLLDKIAYYLGIEENKVMVLSEFTRGCLDALPAVESSSLSTPLLIKTRPGTYYGT